VPPGILHNTRYQSIIYTGHANVAMKHLYDRRKSTPEDSSSFRAKY
jgi:hypothetical protein